MKALHLHLVPFYAVSIPIFPFIFQVIYSERRYNEEMMLVENTKKKYLRVKDYKK